MHNISSIGLYSVAAITMVGLWGCDTLMTEKPTAGDDFESPFDGLSPDLNAVFLLGDENFEHAFTPEEGLGPIFNNNACVGCHPGDGRGTPELGFFRFSRDGDLLPKEGGHQHQDKALAAVPVETIPAGVERSFRLPPPVFGVGLLESIPVDTVLAYADENDTDGDGISGRPNWVTPPFWVPESEPGGGAGPQLGRFSRKAQISTLVQQVAEAYHQDMGITSDFLPEENPHPQAGSVAMGDLAADPEIPAGIVFQTVMYIRLLQPPDRGDITDEVRRGEQHFVNIGCASCHVPLMHTGPQAIPALDRQPVALYSDLLLHDMGPGLADNRPDGQASGTEWKTPPLWGTRIVGDFLNGEQFYLHDGRANNLHDAIIVHGGEAQSSRDGYYGLSESDQQAVVAFLESL
ncbi:MAG: di-heme oxidoredictase family protein [Candidatus Latescibacterota bacterium]|nr:di-heme oxidoredictase family protein [Candidatus Latescibacterota bacterium]